MYDSQHCVLGLDVGGTQVRAELYKLRGERVPVFPVASSRWSTQKGVQGHVAQVAQAVAWGRRTALTRGGVLAGVGIGSPGRFDPQGKIRPGTSSNMELQAGEFDNLDIKKAYVDAIIEAAPSLSTRLIVRNDAVMMLSGMLEQIVADSTLVLTDQHGSLVSVSSLKNTYVALLGIGTGVGHAIAAIDSSRRWRFVTDGHASQLRIAVDPCDYAILRRLNLVNNVQAQTRILLFPDLTARAGDLFRGPVMNALDAVRKKTMALDMGVPDGAVFGGKYMARTIIAIRNASSPDVSPADGWSTADKEEAAKTSIYLVGGGVGQSQYGKEMVRTAAVELDRSNITGIRLVHIRSVPSPARAAVVEWLNVYPDM